MKMLRMCLWGQRIRFVLRFSWRSGKGKCKELWDTGIYGIGTAVDYFEADGETRGGRDLRLATSAKWNILSDLFDIVAGVFRVAMA